MKSFTQYIFAVFLILLAASCVPPTLTKVENKSTPSSFNHDTDTTSVAAIQWQDYFPDSLLRALIGEALKNNQELNILTQEINIARNEVRARKGEYLPFVDLETAADVEKVGRYTRSGTVEASNDIDVNKPFPDPLPNFLLVANVTWQVDIWKKLRNAKKSAVMRYLSSSEGRNFMVTRLVAEIANSYYELLALDNQLDILQQNIQIQQSALEIVKLEKQAAKVTELAVRRFEAEVLKNQSRLFYIRQSIVEAENRINFLAGRFPQPVKRNSAGFTELVPGTIRYGVPTQLLQNRPDVRQAELQLSASRLDVLSARANFYPTLNVNGALGLEAFKATYLLSKPESMLYSLAGGLVQPLVNRNAIKAMYQNANARQIQAAYEYERTILRAYVEVANQVANISNLQQSYNLRTQQVQALTESIDISTRLFRSARADYMEVLLTQRDALESKFELVETKKQQMNAVVNIYQQLGGGWR